MKSKELRTFALKHFVDQPLEYGEDKQFGGYFAFLDVDGQSIQFIQVYMKALQVSKQTFSKFQMCKGEIGKYGQIWYF